MVNIITLPLSNFYTIYESILYAYYHYLKSFSNDCSNILLLSKYYESIEKSLTTFISEIFDNSNLDLNVTLFRCNWFRMCWINKCFIPISYSLMSI